MLLVITFHFYLKIKCYKNWNQNACGQKFNGSKWNTFEFLVYATRCDLSLDLLCYILYVISIYKFKKSFNISIIIFKYINILVLYTCII